MQLSHLPIVMLPLPDNKTDWFEFNTSCKEFFDKYHVSRKTYVPGTGPDPNPFTTSVAKQKKKKKKQVADSSDPTQVPTIAGSTPLANTAVEYEHLTRSMQVFCRSLLKYVGDLFNEDACLGDFTADNVFVGGGRVAIVGVKVMKFTRDQAGNNCASIYNIISERMPVDEMPADVEAAMVLLQVKDAVDKFELILNNVAWMESLERNHMVGDLYEDFSEFLPADVQVTVTQKLEGLEHSDLKFKKNWLIYVAHAYCLPDNATKSDEGFQNYLKRKATELQTKPDDPNLDVLSDDKAHLDLDLYSGRKYFGTIRHLYTHLSDIARKWVCISTPS